MDKKFLNKVVDQIVNETKIDYDNKEIYFPFFRSPSHFRSLNLPIGHHFSLPLTSRSSFSKHCKEVYGLNEREIEYVWKVYIDDIIYKIKEEQYR